MLSRIITTRIQLLLGVVITLAICSSSVQAQFAINFDENGKGTVQTTAGLQPLPSIGNVVDPFDPTNGLMPLAYNVTAAIPGVVPFFGDIDLIESDGTHTDLLRWTQGAQGMLLLVYSDRAEPGETPDLADVGIPLKRQQPLLTLPETGPENGPNGLFGYTPNVGDPGFYPVPPGPVTYNFTSDGAIPEPATCSLVALGLALVFAIRRRSA